MSAPATHAAPDRRRQLFRLLGRETPGPLTPDDAGTELLDKLLLGRLREVYVQAARPWPGDAEELVHDVRVASRRLVEALALVAPLLGRGRTKKAQRRAKSLRRALGVSREADVLVEDFRNLAAGADLGEHAVHALDSIASHGQDALRTAMRKHPPEALLAAATDVLVWATQPERSSTLRQIAGPHLYARTEAATPLLASLEDPDAWRAHHDLRIRCKALRYSVEILAPPFSEIIDGPDVITRMKRLQDVLGVLNDAQDLLDWLDGPRLEDAVGGDLARQVRELGQAQRRERYRAARDTILQEGPSLFGELRRAAGHIGHLA